MLLKDYRICHISTMTGFGGVEWLLTDFLTHPGNTSFHHSLLTTSSSPEVLRPILMAGVDHYEPSRRFHYDPSLIVQMARWLKTNKIHLVHGYDEVGNAWGYLAARLAGCPLYVGGEHGTVWTSKSLRFVLTYLAYKGANRVVVNSKASEVMVRVRYRIPAEKITVIYNGIAQLPYADRSLLRRQWNLDSKLVIGSVGRLVERKGYTTLLDAAAIISKQRTDVTFVIIGGGFQSAILEKGIRDRGLDGRVILTGWRQDARVLLQMLDLFISTSITEPFGNVLVEAALAGLPIIAPAIDGIPEAVENGTTGLLLEPSMVIKKPWGKDFPEKIVHNERLNDPLRLDPEILATTILLLVENPDQRAQYGNAGKTRAAQLFSLQRYVLSINNLYSKLCSSQQSIL